VSYLNQIRGTSSFIGPAMSRPRSTAGEAPRAGNAVVPVNPVQKREPFSPPNQRPAAPFLAHLIATNADEMQTRARRRAMPSDASAAYAARKDRPIRSGILLSLSA
jgi:hypothetical protein